ncbi:MAG: sugar phosphate nucleotidyltransferase [Betaproteobacteria bacterium]
MKAVVLAGGRGTRLRPLTHDTPKGLVPMVTRPFIEYQIELLRTHGIHRIVLCLNYMASEFSRLLQDGSKWGVSVEYAVEEAPLGTAGAIKNCEAFLGGERALVLNGDVLTDVDLAKLLAEHEERGSDVTITTATVDDPAAYGLVLADREGRVTGFLEKPGWDEAAVNTINAGIYVIEPSVIAALPQGREVSFEREVIPALLVNGAAVRAHSSQGYWLDIGTPRNYLKAHMDVLDGKIDVVVPGRKVGRGIWSGKNPVVHRTARLTGPVVMGHHVSIQARAHVGPRVVLGHGCVVAEGAQVSESVLHENVQVGKGARIRRCVLAAGVRVGDACCLDSMVVAPSSAIGAWTCVDPGLSAPLVG